MKILHGQNLVKELRNLSDKVTRRLWIAVPYIGSPTTVRRILGKEWFDSPSVSVKLLTDTSDLSCINTETIQHFYDRGEVKTLTGLHAKIYIIDDTCLISSANRCGSGFVEGRLHLLSKQQIMANKPIPMSKLRQVLHLFCQGQSKLQIAELTGISRNTVKRYLRDFMYLRTSWEEISRLSDKDLDDLFHHKEPKENTNSRLKELHEYFAENDKRLKKRGVTLLTLFIDYHTKGSGRLSRTRFYHYYGLWKKKVEPSMHIEHKAGDKVFVDFAGEKLPYVDKQSGEIKEAEIFVAILGASQYTWVEAVESQKAEDLITACENALHFFGGCPLAIVSDNLKSAVTKSDRYEPSLNENFEAFADHYSMAVIPARAYKPKDKSLVEGAVRIVYQRVYAHLPEGEYYTLEALNERIKTLIGEHNKTTFTGRNYSREEQFLEMERGILQPLPQKRFEIRRSAFVTVMKNGHICLSTDKHYYSIPYRYIGKKVRVLYSKSKVEVYYKYELLASHPRTRSPHNYTTDPSHLATQHQKMLEWSPDYFIQQARVIHPDVEYYIVQVLDKKQHPEQAYKSCQGILSFAKRLGEGRLINACRHAQACEIYNFRIIETILKNGMDRYDALQEETNAMPIHENIRGEEYYS